ncbi:MAG: arsenate reductase ArsC [Planctomycetota bacterium]
MDRKKRVLFFCVTNSCRSQMAEAWARGLRSGELEPFSAGARLGVLDPQAAQVMAEAGLDLNGQSSKTLADLPGVEFDLVVSLCSVAHAALPALPGNPPVLRLEVPNPRHGIDGREHPERLLRSYRRVRDQIRRLIDALPTDAIAPARRHSTAGTARPSGTGRASRSGMLPMVVAP